MNKESGSPTTDPPLKPLITQRGWRFAGGVFVGGAALMAWYGVKLMARSPSPLFLLVYWGIALLLLCGALYMALLDVRYIRLQYLLSQREIFLETLGSEEFRTQLSAAQRNGTGAKES